MSTPSSRPPPPPSSNAKYAIVVVVLLCGMGAVFWLRKPSASTAAPAPLASVAPPAPPTNSKLDDIPPPPPPEDSSEAKPNPGPRVIYAPNAGCDGKCRGTSPPELGQALQVRASQARRCYNQALAQDSQLKGHVSIAVRIGPGGNVCSANVASNDMGTPNVANCAANIFRSAAAYPSPRGGCVDANIPISFVQQH
jgi:outer membrane biosynthesis protein TonB